MKQSTYNKIIYLCLLLLAVLPVFSAFNLTWKELLRLFIITLGLLYLYVKYFRRTMPQSQRVEGPGNLEPRTSNFDPTKPRTLNLEPLLLSIVYIFLITQFDPATSAINSIIPQSRLNWFFIASSALIFVAFGAFLLQRFGAGWKGNLEPRTRNQEPGISFSFLDKFVLAAGTVIIIVSLIVAKKVSPVVGTSDRLLAIVKISEYVMIYFVITRFVGCTLFYENGTSDVVASGLGRWTGRRLLYWFLVSCLVLVVAIGCCGKRMGLYFYQKAQKSMRGQDLEGALSQCRRALYCNPEIAGARLLSGKILSLKRGMWNIVVSDLLSEEPIPTLGVLTYKEAFNLGLALYNFKAYQGAVYYLNSALEIDPTDAECHYWLGRTYEAIGNTRSAFDNYDKAIDLQPNLAVGYFRRGLLRESKKDLASAVEDFEKTTRLAPESGLVWFHLGQIYRERGQLHKAQTAYQKVVEISSDYLPAWYQLYSIYRISGREAAAVRVVDQILKLEPEHKIQFTKEQNNLWGFNVHFPAHAELDGFYVLFFWDCIADQHGAEKILRFERRDDGTEVYRIGHRYYGLTGMNLIQNGDFEDDVPQDGFPSGWGTDIYEVLPEHHAVQTMDRTGRSSKCLVLRNSKSVMYTGCASDPIPVKPGEAYLQAGGIKSINGNAYFGRRWFDSEKNAMEYDYAATDIHLPSWKYYSQVITPPLNSAYCCLWAINYETQGKAYFDDIIFVKLP